jgi:crotonobetainyl-CoA:carnitine CoA-transferase CaiB-like acyl-CoA transferase
VNPTEHAGSLAGVRVVEFGDHTGEYCGLVLAGLGAEVIKVEPPGGCASRWAPPFAGEVPDPTRSLPFWVHNRAKLSIVLDLDSESDRATFLDLVAAADVLLDSSAGGFLAERGLDSDTLRARYPQLISARITPFGEHGPRRHWKGSDLVHLALGGVMMNCGYDPDPFGNYDTAPVAPQLGHSYAIAGEQMAFTVVAALVARQHTGAGQHLSCAIHEAVAKNTEGDLMSWVVLRTPFHRQTCRHSAPTVSRHRSIFATKDGRWYLAMTRDATLLKPFLDKYGLGGDIRDGSEETDPDHRVLPGMTAGSASNMDAVEHTIRRYRFDDVPWREAQEAGLMWVPLRKPHENATDEHWLRRGTYSDVDHPELGRTLRYPTSKWIATESGWVTGRRAPLVDEDRAAVLAVRPRSCRVPTGLTTPERLSPERRPFALQGVRVLDFTWFLASAGATRFLAALGADVIKVEWHKNLDPRRGGAPVGGRAARAVATEPVPSRWPADLPGPVGAQYNNKNPGKRAISLNVKHPVGLAMAKRLAERSDIVTEGFSPGVMESWRLGYDDLRGVKPDIIYAKQSGMGSHGVYGRYRTVGPVAAAFSGISEMSGLPEPYPPAGWGYSYLDWFGAYSFALAILGALYQRGQTGLGQSIDASQCEVGLYLTGVPTLDWEVNRRAWRRGGARSLYGTAAPEGVYRCAGTDRWLAITCATDADWRALTAVAGHPEWCDDPRFGTAAARRDNADDLNRCVETWTRGADGFELMEKLQTAGVAAGVAQTAADRADSDPQLAALHWLTELDATDFGRWPVAAPSVTMSQTPQYIGGLVGRGAPTYGEHNAEVYAELLGLSSEDLSALAADGVI